MSKKRGTRHTAKGTPAQEVPATLRASIMVRARRFPLSSAAVLVTVILFGSIFIVGLLVPGQSRTKDSGASLMTSSVTSLSTSNYITMVATMNHRRGTLTYYHDGSNWELDFSTPSLGTYSARMVNGVVYVKGGIAYFRSTKDPAKYADRWYRWPYVSSTQATLSGANTLSLLGIPGTGGTKGTVKKLVGIKVIPVKYQYLTVYVPISGNAAPIGMSLTNPSTKSMITMRFGYHDHHIRAPNSARAPVAVLHYLANTELENGLYQSVGEVITSAPVFLAATK